MSERLLFDVIMAIKSVKINSPIRRVALVATAVFCVLGAYFFAKWGLANTASTRTDLKEIAEFTTEIAPGDPQTHYSAAVLLEKSFLPEDFSKSLAEYEKATALAPHNYLLWLALGRARERNGNAEGAEKALRKAVELAPNYAETQWALGNALLRRGKSDEAFAEIRKAVAADAKFTDPAVSTAWQIFDGDIAKIKQVIGDSERIRVALALFLAKQKRFDESFEIWNALPAEEKKNLFKKNGEELYNQFVTEKKFRGAVQIISQISGNEISNFAFGKINNGGFEDDIKTQNPGLFEWSLADGGEPQIAFSDSQKHGGNRSLFMIFNSAEGRNFRRVSQNVAVESNKTFEFSAFYKSDLKAQNTLRWEIVDASDGKILASTENLSPVSDWTNIKAKFTTSPTTEAVIIQLVRVNCGGTVCPISGKVWFDDLSLN
ncbi:MAG: tetratricopeptide repeat protein [Pyrinomonadaceae bacterium]|nr:tetratricopeptide repeat protein [Pyrinomonadaceae bacterium]